MALIRLEAVGGNYKLLPEEHKQIIGGVVLVQILECKQFVDLPIDDRFEPGDELENKRPHIFHFYES